MVVVLPVPFTPTTRITSGDALDFVNRPGAGGAENCQQLFLQQTLEFLSIFDLFTVGLVAEFGEHFLRGSVAEIGGDERGLEIVEGVAVNLLANRNDFLDALRQVFAGSRNRLLHAVKEAGFLFFRAAKQGLNHKRAKDRLYGPDAGVADRAVRGCPNFGGARFFNRKVR